MKASLIWNSSGTLSAPRSCLQRGSTSHILMLLNSRCHFHSSDWRETLHKGTKVLIPYRQLHLNGDVLGSDPLNFNAEQFLMNKGLSRSPSYRPFGGGMSLCPGRLLARRQAITFAAVVPYRFDIGLTEVEVATVSKPSPRFPSLEEGKPSLSIMGPVNEDVCVTIKQACH